jgi:hypothetical protein
MSLEVYVLLKRSRLPSLASWQDALDGSGLGVKIHSTFNPVEDSGFVPCSYKNSETGFEFFLGSRADLIEAYPDLKQKTEGLDTSAAFVWSGDLNECVSAVSSAAILAQLSDGLLYDPQEDHLYGGSEAILQARQTFESNSSSSQ